MYRRQSPAPPGYPAWRTASPAWPGFPDRRSWPRHMRPCPCSLGCRCSPPCRAAGDSRDSLPPPAGRPPAPELWQALPSRRSGEKPRRAWAAPLLRRTRPAYTGPGSGRSCAIAFSCVVPPFPGPSPPFYFFRRRPKMFPPAAIGMYIFLPPYCLFRKSLIQLWHACHNA